MKARSLGCALTRHADQQAFEAFLIACRHDDAVGLEDLLDGRDGLPCRPSVAMEEILQRHAWQVLSLVLKRQLCRVEDAHPAKLGVTIGAQGSPALEIFVRDGGYQPELESGAIFSLCARDGHQAAAQLLFARTPPQTVHAGLAALSLENADRANQVRGWYHAWQKTQVQSTLGHLAPSESPPNAALPSRGLGL